MLDYGYRSRCCKAPIRFSHKKVKDTKQRKTIMVCTKCDSRDVNIVSKEELQNQT